MIKNADCYRDHTQNSADDVAGLRQTINDDGVWRIRRRPGSPSVEVFRVEEAGHGKILTDEFINWRIKLALSSSSNGGGGSDGNGST